MTQSVSVFVLASGENIHHKFVLYNTFIFFLHIQNRQEFYARNKTAFLNRHIS